MWLALTLATAACESARDVLSKRRLRDVDEHVVAFGLNLAALLLLLPVAAVRGLPAPQPAFWGALAVGGTLNTVGVVLYLRALRCSDLSLAAPMIAFTPLFLLFVAPLIAGDHTSSLGFAGVLLMVGGAYVLRSDARRGGLLGPFRALLADRGPRLVLIVAFLFSITSSIDKLGVRAASPLAWSIGIHAVAALGLAPLAFRARRLTPSLALTLLPIGLLSALASLSQMTALAFALVPYVNAVKRVGIAFNVLAGRLFFGEPRLGRRLLGVTFMIAGIVCIALPTPD